MTNVGTGIEGELVGDGQLLRRYARDQSEAAFAELVGRHVDWVYSSAVRQLRDPHLAEDVTQGVFILLARKAPGFDERVVLSAWLFRAPRYIAADALKVRRRRKYHERELGAIMNTTPPPEAGSGDSDAWAQVAPALDDAVAALGARDRTALLLRFYQKKSHAQVGAALGVSEDAAKMRVSRALDKLRKLLARRGVATAALPAAALATAMSGNVVHAAPAGLGAAALNAVAGGASSSATATIGISWTKGLVLAMSTGKAFVAAGVVAVIVAIGAVVYRSTSASPPANVAANPSSVTPQTWREGGTMAKVYGLGPGQSLKRVAPLFGSVRREYVERAMKPNIHPGMFGKQGPTSIAFEWTDGEPEPLRLCMFENIKPTLSFVLQATLGGRRWDFEAPPGLLDTVVEGDWVVRKSAAPAERAAALQQALRDEAGLPVQIERKRINAEVIIVSGAGLPQLTNAVQIYSDKLSDNKPDNRGQENDFKDFLGQIAMVTQKRVLNESAVAPETKVRAALHTSALFGKMPPQRAAAKLDLILRNLSRQTGLQFSRTQRPVEMWVVTPAVTARDKRRRRDALETFRRSCERENMCKRYNRHSRCANRGFTLPELLAVIGIVAVLIGLIVPAVIAVRRKSQSARCQANLRTVGQMLAAYQNENNGWIFPVRRDAFGVIGFGANVPPHERWPMLVFKVEGAPLPPAYDVAGYDISRMEEPQYDPKPYTPAVLLCPSDDDDARQAHTYVLNNHLADEGIKAGRTIRGISASDIVVAGEKRPKAADYYMEFGDYDRVVEPFRHGPQSGSNYVYQDGHVATVLPKDAKLGIDPWQVVPQ